MIATTMLMAACASLGGSRHAAVAEIAPVAGSGVHGIVVVERVAEGLKLSVSVAGLALGEHGIHINEAGDCDATRGAGVKGHFNPTRQPHGGLGMAHHAGDMPNLYAGYDGKAEALIVLPGLTIGAGEMNIDGRALTIHAFADDYTSQPAGNSGKPVGCGVIKATR